jgi:hypothetical protein
VQEDLHGRERRLLLEDTDVAKHLERYDVWPEPVARRWLWLVFFYAFLDDRQFMDLLQTCKSAKISVLADDGTCWYSYTRWICVYYFMESLLPFTKSLATAPFALSRVVSMLRCVPDFASCYSCLRDSFCDAFCSSYATAQ